MPKPSTQQYHGHDSARGSNLGQVYLSPLGPPLKVAVGVFSLRAGVFLGVKVLSGVRRSGIK